MKKKYTVRKCAAVALAAASITFSPIMTGSAFAHGAAPSASVEKAGVVIIPQGAQGAEVTDLQRKLQNHGYSLKVDGVYGADTQQSIIAFQNAQGWNADGIVDAPTLNALNHSSVARSSKANNVAPSDQPVQTAAVNTANAVNNGSTIAIAKSLVGSPYVFGGTTPSGFDSSGFINYVFSKQGIQLSRTHAGMWANDGTRVGAPSVGDVVFFADTYKSGVSHSGIYIGNNQMIHAGTESTGVEITSPSEWDYYWSKHYIGAKRF